MTKFKLTSNTKVVFGITLYQIQALKDFGSVKAGDLGGYVEKESNLSQEGNCWVSGSAQVYGDAHVYSNALVSGNAQVYGNSQVYNNARVCDDALVSGSAMVSGNATVSSSALVYSSAMVSGNATVSGSALVYDSAHVSGNATVSGNAQVYGDAQVYGNARVYGDAWVSLKYTFLCQIQGSKHFVTIMDDNIQIGCLLKTYTEWKKEVKTIGLQEGYTKEQVEEYKKYIELAKPKTTKKVTKKKN